MNSRALAGLLGAIILVALALLIPTHIWVESPYPHPRTEIAIAELADFNFKTREEIFSQRQRALLAYPQFYNDQTYSPSYSVFGQVQNGKPWWGILGLSYYGPGDHSIEGASFQSEFILNPYLLVGLQSGHAFIVTDQNLAPKPVYPRPLKVYWNNDGEQAEAVYDLTSFQEGCVRIHEDGLKNKVDLVATNARDLGWHFLSISSQESSNVSAQYDEVVAEADFYHTGGSCKYPGGCNNLSPYQPAFDITITALPARIYIKLWKTNPGNAQAPADMVFVINMI